MRARIDPAADAFPKARRGRSPSAPRKFSAGAVPGDIGAPGTRLNPGLDSLIRLALAEDLGRAGDLSTRCFLPREARLRGRIVVKQPGVLCGLRVAEEVFRRAAPGCSFRPLARDGRAVRPGQAVAEVRGPREILTAERTALNFLQRLSGVATLTRAYADRLRGTRAKLLDTRKTLPGWRALDKYAVRCGGGTNHRMGLHDMVMLKDNHLEWLMAPGAHAAPEARRGRSGSALGPAPGAHAAPEARRGRSGSALGPAPGAAGRLASRLRRFRGAHPGIPVLIEAKTRREVDAALACGADIILLDNMPPARLRREIARIRSRARRPRPLIEVSGGVGLRAVRAVARLGADRISVGRLTHSAPALDMSLELNR